MNSPLTLTGRILSASGWIDGSITFNEHITDITGTPVEDDGHADCYILPGFIDCHVHGGGGKDLMQGGDAVESVTRHHAQHGTTSMLATTMTDQIPNIKAALIALDINNRVTGGSRLLGVHLEGPYINVNKKGAQPDPVKRADVPEFNELNAIAPIKILTIAPEIEGHLDIIKTLAAQGVRVQVGHSTASYEEGVSALEAGATGFTHLFNAMNGLHHREPGLVGTALAHGQYAEIIPDLLHVHPGAIKTALRAIPHLFCVTDSTAASGMADGDYQLGSQTVTKCMGGVRLADGTLAGSALTMDVALQNLVSIGLSLSDASNRLSLFPANYLNEPQRGRLQIGAFSDIVTVNKKLKLTQVYIEGEKVELK